MIFIGFVLITGLLLLFAHFSGNMFHFLNYDSIFLVIFPGLIFSIFTFRWKEYIGGIKSIFAFRLKSIKKDNKITMHFKSLIYITVGFGILSTAQGLISYILGKRDYERGLVELSEFALNTTLDQVFVYASFTTVYALLISIFLLYPISIIHKPTYVIHNENQIII